MKIFKNLLWGNLTFILSKLLVLYALINLSLIIEEKLQNFLIWIFRDFFNFLNFVDDLAKKIDFSFEDVFLYFDLLHHLLSLLFKLTKKDLFVVLKYLNFLIDFNFEFLKNWYHLVLAVFLSNLKVLFFVLQKLLFDFHLG